MFERRTERHDHYHHYPDLEEVKIGIKKLHDLVVPKLEKLMSKATELQTSLDDLAARVTEANSEIEVELAVISAPGTPDADVDIALEKIRALTASVQAGVDRLKSDNPPV